MTDVTTMNPPVMAGSAVVPVVGAPLDDERHERFVHALLAGEPIGDAYQLAGFRSGSRKAAWAHGCRLRARRDVRERIELLTRLAAERAVIDRSVLLAQLYEMTQADPAELSSVVTGPCDTCWTDLATAAAAAIDRGEVPDTDSPQPGCERCKGRGVQRVHITDTHELSGPARRLFQGARYKSDGSIEIDRVDQLAARRELHDLLGMRVQRSESKNLNVNVGIDAADADISPDAILRLYHESRDVRHD